MAIIQEIYGGMKARELTELSIQLPKVHKLLPISPCAIAWSDLLEYGDFGNYDSRRDASRFGIDPEILFFLRCDGKIDFVDRETYYYWQSLEKRFKYNFGQDFRIVPNAVIEAMKLSLD